MKTLRYIRVDSDKCSGCRSCEAICSAFHVEPKYSLTNPKRSRIRVFWDEDSDLFVPILAGQYTDAECNGRHVTIINGKEYGDCSFCRAACPSRDLFIEPDADIALKCDICGEPPPPDGPSCVRVCLYDALKYVERVVGG
jgi:benzoyl-CoA reductase subunit BamC